MTTFPGDTTMATVEQVIAFASGGSARFSAKVSDDHRADGSFGRGQNDHRTGAGGANGLQFADADDYHSAASKEKMASGRPLNDADRAPCWRR